MKYTFISVPALGDKQNTFLNIKGKLAEYAQTNKFVIPEFKVNRDELKNIMFNLRVML
jgi:V-type H+-transporting ATPase subunit C